MTTPMWPEEGAVIDRPESLRCNAINVGLRRGLLSVGLWVHCVQCLSRTFCKPQGSHLLQANVGTAFGQMWALLPLHVTLRFSHSALSGELRLRFRSAYMDKT